MLISLRVLMMNLKMNKINDNNVYDFNMNMNINEYNFKIFFLIL